ncbi:hypothetical protein [Roseospira visakhapatnamensis]|uniref:Histidine kinase n=1 Tax=Roseospira visakhapatnamensis TaxID=390880 RepID=A0A7W6RCE0_9PROT|nr:hypothetical protein [Roseospira visakhapatnamensis]MBB4265837.1 hypothetical protein [Roseospira visakhapatnamensis]
MAALRVCVEALVVAAHDSPAAEDAAVVSRRMIEADELFEVMEGAASDGRIRTVRHDLMNALGAVDNYAELIMVDEGMAEAGAVREAVRRVVNGVRDGSGATYVDGQAP